MCERLSIIILALFFSVGSFAGITANSNAGQITTGYTTSVANVPIFVWCASTSSATPASLTATPSSPGTYTFQWYKHNASTSSWQNFGTAATGTTSSINNLQNGGYRVEIKLGATIIECFHVWVWNLLANTSISKTGNCGMLNLNAVLNTNDTFIYYNPPPPQSLISATTQISVCFSATHTWVSDLGFYLVGPAGCGSPTVTLSPSPGSTCNNGNNVTNLCFSNTSATNFNICTAATPLAGAYGSYGTGNTPIAWSSLYGCNAAEGGWKVQVYDCYSQDVGSLTNATITFSNLSTGCGGPSSITYNSGTINSAINDNSCSAASASIYTVPAANVITTPIKTFATRSISWSSPTPGVSFINPAATATPGTVPQGIDTIDLTVVYTAGNAQCTSNTRLVHSNTTTTATDTQVICQGKSYSFNGVSYTASNTTAKDTFYTAAGCDSVVTLYLTVTPYLSGIENASICQGQSYVFNGTSYSASTNTPTDTIKNAGGCDSIVTLHLLVNPYRYGARNITICQGQSYTFNGIIYTSSVSNVKDTLPNPGGCDSVVTLNLIVSPFLTGVQTVAICQGQSYNFNGNNYTTNNNTAKDTLKNSAGCDSIITLNLTVNSYLYGTRNITICQGQSYTFNGINYTSSVSALKDTLPNPSGCDSIVTLNLTVNPYLSGTRNITICQGNSYVFNGITYTASTNTPRDTLANATGCDSIVTLHLTVSPYLTGIQTANICQGQSYAFNGTNYSSSNFTAKDTLKTSSGCDSIVTLNLTLNNYLYGIRTATICQGQSYIFNGTVYTTNNSTARDTFANATGCDSIITLHLTVTPYVTGTRTITLCNGGSYSFNGTTYTTSNYTAKDTLPNPTGCDSLITLQLTVLPPLSGKETVVICNGDSYTFNGTVYTVSNTTAKDTLRSVQGCDSIVTLELTVLPPPVDLKLDTTVCGSYTFNGTTYSETVSIRDTFINSFGCDSVYMAANITVHPSYSINDTVDVAACDSLSYEGKVYFENTTLHKEFKTTMGCDSMKRTVHISIENFKLELTSKVSQPYLGEQVELATSGNIKYTVHYWSPSSLFADQQALTQRFYVTEPVIITVAAASENGCADTTSISFDPLNLSYDVAVPSAFTPNGDGKNDFFRPWVAMTHGYNVKYFRVYNRWGQMVFQQSGENLNGWDGSFKGMPAEIGVYNYMLEVEYPDGQKVKRKGDVTLVR